MLTKTIDVSRSIMGSPFIPGTNVQYSLNSSSNWACNSWGKSSSERNNVFRKKEEFIIISLGLKISGNPAVPGDIKKITELFNHYKGK
jgi:hypothetical protein